MTFDDSGHGSDMDVYLQPHSDDVCFSLGALANRRRRGALLTAFPVAGFVARPPGQSAPPPEQVTATRMAEDRAFARACDLQASFLNLPTSSLIGRHPFDLTGAAETRRRVVGPLMDALIGQTPAPPCSRRAWLFCPAAVGGHVDHAAVFDAVIGRYDELSAYYRIAFYEDLHYASKSKVRRRGLERMFDTAAVRPLGRRYWRLNSQDVQRKLALLRLYSSQFLDPPTDLAQFTPAAAPRHVAHEAFWSELPFGEESAVLGGVDRLRHCAMRILPRPLHRSALFRTAGVEVSPDL